MLIICRRTMQQQLYTVGGDVTDRQHGRRRCSLRRKSSGGCRRGPAPDNFRFYSAVTFAICLALQQPIVAFAELSFGHGINTHIAAILPAKNFTVWSSAFQEAMSAEASRTPGLSLPGVTLAAVIGGVLPVLTYVCDAVYHHNVTAFIIVGDQHLINTVSIVTRQLHVPLLGYNIDRPSVDIRGERPLYLQLDPAKSLSAWAIMRILEANQWFYASLIIEDAYANDGFVEAFYALTSASSKPWRVEDHILVQCNSTRSAREMIDYQLLALLENQSRVIILHASACLAEVILEVAVQNGFVEGFAWFVTEEIMRGPSKSTCVCDWLLQSQQAATAATLSAASSNSNIDGYSSNADEYATYPEGLLSVATSKGLRPRTLMSDVVRLIGEGLRRYHDVISVQRPTAAGESDHPRTVTSSPFSGSGCAHSGRRYFRDGELVHRLLKNTSVPTEYGQLTFDSDGVRTQADFEIFNLVSNRSTGLKQWNAIGYIRNDSIQFSTILWPGKRISGPPAKGRRTLRVVTAVSEPFVMEQPAVNDNCTTSVYCLRVNTKDKEMLDDIFKDFENRIHNDSHPYNVSCCKGLSIMLLERLARDLEFHIQLYITADEQFGHIEYNPTAATAAAANGGSGQPTDFTSADQYRWTGLVEDLLNGAAHMAVSAFSITRSRSRVIDFTVPYFTAGFSIVVSEKKRRPPIYAFMEPFDGWVWISIVVSATVVAVALSLLEWNSPFGLNPWGRKRKTNYTLGSGLNMVYAILFQHTIKTKSPKAWPSKWLQNFWAGASIFIYSSYTANLAAFLAGKNSAVVITGVHDPQLLDETTSTAMINGTAVEDYTRQVNPRLSMKTRRYHIRALSTEAALTMLLNGTLDAYLDDTPIVEHVRTNIDAKCQLRMIGAGFGEDAYGIGLPKNSMLKNELTQKILEYHESGFMEDLVDLFFRRTRCKYHSNDNQLQGEAASMTFEQHAGLYLLLVVGIFVCILLMFVEHAVFKWIVSYWRRKPSKSFWKSQSMMFWSQRLHRIITSEELVSPHHSAREMIEVMKNRDFAKLFQKSVRKQEKLARNRKNLFNVVEQLKWKNRPGEDELASTGVPNSTSGATLGGVLKSVSADVLPTSSRTSPLHLVVDMPASISTDDVMLSPQYSGREAAAIGPFRDGLGGGRDSSDDDPAPKLKNETRRHFWSFSADVEAATASALSSGLKQSQSSSRNGRRRGRQLHSQSIDDGRTTSPAIRTMTDCSSYSSFVTSASANPTDVPGAHLSPATISTGGVGPSVPPSKARRTFSDVVNEKYRLSATARRLASAGDTQLLRKDDVIEPPVSTSGNGDSVTLADRRARLTNGIISGTLAPSVSVGDSSSGISQYNAAPKRSIIERLCSLPTAKMTSSMTTSPAIDSHDSSRRPGGAARHRRRTVDLAPSRFRDRGQWMPSSFSSADRDDVYRITKSVLDNVTKEELLEMWQSSEKELCSELEVALEQRAELQRKLEQQQQQRSRSSTERLTVT